MNATTRLRRPRAAGISALAPVLSALAPVLLLALLAGACGDAAAGRSPDDGGAPTLVPAVREVYRIGDVEGGSWEAFSRIIAAGFDARGNLYLLDAGPRSVTMVDGAGGFVRTIGRAGGGPGEYRTPVGMAVLPDGRVVVSDAGHRALLLFDADGAFVRSIPFGDGAMGASVLLPHGDDGLVYTTRAMMMASLGAGPPAEPVDVPIHRRGVGADDAGPDELYRAWTPPRDPPQVSGGSGGMMTVRRATRAFEPQLHVAVLPDGALAVADSASYRIRIVRPGRGVEETFERPIAPVAVTDRERERERARRLQELQDGAGPQVTMMGAGGAQMMTPSQLRPMLEAQIEGMTFWPEIPVIQQLAADREGRLWVRRFGDIGEPGPIEILGRDGALRAVVPAGTVTIPAAFGPDGLAAWIERDDMDVPFVRVGRLTDMP